MLLYSFLSQTAALSMDLNIDSMVFRPFIILRDPSEDAVIY